MFKGNFQCYCFFTSFIHIFMSVFFCYLVCAWCSLGVTIYVLLTYVHGVTSCILTRSHVFSLALELDQMIWSWVVFVSLTKFCQQEHGNNEEKSEKAWNKIMAIMNHSYLAMRHCPSMHSVFESSVRASFKVSLIFGLSCLYPVTPEPLWFLWCHAAHLPSSV